VPVNYNSSTVIFKVRNILAFKINEATECEGIGEY
jgi:hypothetical protein